MFTPADFKTYDLHCGVWSARTGEERKNARAIDKYIVRPFELIQSGKFVEAIDLADNTIQLLDDEGLTGLSLKRALVVWRSTIAAIDCEWRIKAFIKLDVRESGRLTMVGDGDSEEVWLFGVPLVLRRSHDARDARFRAELIEKGAPAVATSRDELLQATAHVGQDDRSLTGHAAHELVTHAVQRRLFDWEDAEYWWPKVFAERSPAVPEGCTFLDEVLSISFPGSDRDA